MQPIRLSAPLRFTTTLTCVDIFVACARAQSPPDVGDVNFGFVLRGTVVNYVWPLIDGTAPISWDNFTLEGFTPTYGVGTGPHFNATFDPDTHLFHWDSAASPPGIYQWSVRASNPFGSDTATFRIDLNVPEPTSLSIAAVGMLGFGYLSRRRDRSFAGSSRSRFIPLRENENCA
jgi:hypothetical protein